LSAVEVEAVAKAFGPVTVLDGVTLRFRQGSFTSLLGPSGSGKTTLLRIIAGFVRPDHGIVRIGGRDVTAMPVHARNIGMVFQSYALFPHLTVAQNVAFGLKRRGIRGAEAARRIEAALALVRLPGFADRYPRELSGGQQQRVALARAIVIEPSVLLLDEPLSALDRKLRQAMQVELLAIQRGTGLTTIFVTHDQEEALALSDHVAILDRGRIVQAGPPAEIYERPRTRFAATFLGDATFFTGRVVAGGVAVGDRILRTTAALPPPGRAATLAVRPEKLLVLRHGEPFDPTLNAVSARVTAAIYAGAASTYRLAALDGTPIDAFVQNRGAAAFGEGDLVQVAWAPEHSVVLEDEPR
jgi:putative spermidine/putrescine transport system ATP-binding protein/spermidine/putrescine transport system ATP-binding protein